MTMTSDDVYRAIHALYHDSDVSGKQKASSWLCEFQKSVFAWKISDELLRQNRDFTSSYFAAQTLRTKIQFSFHELPPESHHLLRDSLVQHICTVSKNDFVILTQLCLALADLALQMVSWKMAFLELFEQLSTNVKLIPALLEILTVLPEEFHNFSPRLGTDRRKEIRHQFTLVGPMLLQLMVAYTEAFGTTDPRIYATILKCLGNWLDVGAIPSVELAHSSLLFGVFRSLGNCDAPSMVHGAASDCICQALVIFEERDAYVGLKQALLQGVHTLIEPYHLSVKVGDNDKCVNFCRLFTELAQSLVEDIMKTPGQGTGSLRTLEMVLVCSENNDREVAEITFNFWFRLSEFLQPSNDTHLEMFKPYVVRLLAALRKHCRLEPGLEGLLKDGDDFVEFRARVSDLIKNVVFVVGSCDCFRQMFEDLKNEGNNTWDMLEASLFVMCAVADNVSKSEIIPDVLGAILNLPDSAHVALRLTCVQLVGQLCKWISHHPQTIESILNFLLKCLHQPQLATMAASALQDICIFATGEMRLHFDGLLLILRNMQQFNKAAVGLFKGTARILAEMPFPMISKGVSQMCLIQTGELFRTIQDGSKDSPINSLNRLTAIFRNLRLTIAEGVTHPCTDVVQEIWPILSETLLKFQHDHRIIESCCKCIRYMIRCVGPQSSCLLEPVVKLIVQLYPQHPHSCYLYLGSILVDECDEFPGYHAALLEMLVALCVPTFLLLDGPNNLHNHPDTVEDLFRLCSRYQRRIMVPFVQSTMFKPIIQCGLVACKIAHRETKKSVVAFFKDLIYFNSSKSRDSEICELVSACLAEHGALLITNLVNSCICYQQFFVIADLADVIFGLMYFDRRAVCSWLEEALKLFLAQSFGGEQEQLTDFILELAAAKTCSDVRKTLSRLRE